jgi:hypothetical protein
VKFGKEMENKVALFYRKKYNHHVIKNIILLSGNEKKSGKLKIWGKFWLLTNSIFYLFNLMLI